MTQSIVDLQRKLARVTEERNCWMQQSLRQQSVIDNLKLELDSVWESFNKLKNLITSGEGE